MINDFIQQQIILPRIKENGVLVVYETDCRYHDLCIELHSEKLQVIDTSTSSITSCFEALEALSGLGLLAMFILIILGQIDTTFGLASGGAACAMAGGLYASFANMFRPVPRQERP